MPCCHCFSDPSGDCDHVQTLNGRKINAHSFWNGTHICSQADKPDPAEEGTHQEMDWLTWEWVPISSQAAALFWAKLHVILDGIKSHSFSDEQPAKCFLVSKFVPWLDPKKELRGPSTMSPAEGSPKRHLHRICCNWRITSLGEFLEIKHFPL